MAERTINQMVEIFVSAILVAALIPVALLQLAGAVFTSNASGTPVTVDPAIVSLFTVISIAVTIVVVLLFFQFV